MTQKVFPMPMEGGGYVAYVIPGGTGSYEGLAEVHQVFTELQSSHNFELAPTRASKGSPSKSGNPHANDDREADQPHTQKMNDQITRQELLATLSAIEERMDRRVVHMEQAEQRRAEDYRHELSLRDDQLRRELDLRQESFRAEQASRDAALAEKFSGFLSAQAERDKALEKISEARFERIEKDITSIKSDVKTITADVQVIKVTMAKYLGGAIVIGALASAALGAALKHFFS